MKKSQKKSIKKPLFSHHKHTGRRLPHKHTSYPVVALVIIMVMFVVVGLTIKTAAANVSVNAFVNGPPPSGPATITSPLEGEIFTAVPITVSGTCPVGGGNMVKVYRNGVFSGSVLCSLSGTFSLQSDLFVGSNTLEAKVFNAINVEGPTSPSVIVSYDPPAPTSNPSQITNTPATSNNDDQESASQMVIKAENTYKGYFAGDTINWQLELIGGKAPYALTIDWGDGGLSTVSRASDGVFSVSHVYAKGGANQGSYPIKITATDSDSGSTFLQLVVIVSDKESISSAIPGTTDSDSGAIPPFTLALNYKIAMPIYLGLLLMMATFWLGERQELHKLRSRIVPTVRLKR